MYKEYLNKISKSSKGIEFNEISSLNLDDISNRVLEISDLLRIDEIFIKAGLKLSFIGDKSFLEEKIEVENKYLKYFIGEENDEDLNQALSQYLSQFVGVQDIVANEIANVDKLFEKEDKIFDETVCKINLPKTEDSFCSLDMLLEQQKDVLSNLFSGLNDLEDTKLGETEEVKDSDNVDSSNSIDSVDSVDSVDDIDSAESEEIEIEVQDEPENSKGIIEQENKTEEVCESGVSDDIGGQTENLSASDKQIVKIKLEGIKKTEDIKAEEIENTRIFDSPVIIDDQEETEEAEVTNEIESVDKSEEIDDFDKSGVLDESENESEIYDSDESEDLEILTKDFENFTDSSDSSDSFDSSDTENGMIEDNSGSLLQKELEDEDSDDIDFSDMQKFKKETEYFLKKSKSKRKSDINVDEIRRICQSSERLSKIEDMSKSDDDLLKFLVGLSLGVSEVPKVTKSIISKLRKGSKTVYSNMVVDDTEED